LPHGAKLLAQGSASHSEGKRRKQNLKSYLNGVSREEKK